MFKINLNKNTILLAIAVIGIIVTGVLIYVNQNPDQFPFLNFGSGASNDAIAKKSLDYLNTAVLAGQAQASLVSVSEESGLVKIKIKVGASEYNSYATKDGKLLFPQAFNLEPATSKTIDGNNQVAAAQSCDGLPKTDKPQLEAYIVSRCPYGLQMQRMMADAIQNIPDLAQYIKVRYIGEVSGNTITAMHGESEAKENLRQICIREEQPTKYWSYVSCQMRSSGTEVSCEKSTGVNSAKLNTCISDTSKGVAYAKADFDLAAKYNATGSPTLVLGETQVAEFNSNNQPIFGGRSSDEIKSIVCCGSNSQPGFCSTKLSTDEAATSFSATYSSGSSANANSGTDCE